MHFESDQTLLVFRSTVQSVQEICFQKYSEKSFQECNCSGPKSKHNFRKKMSVMKFVLFLAWNYNPFVSKFHVFSNVVSYQLCLFSITLIECFYCANKTTYYEADEQAKDRDYQHQKALRSSSRRPPGTLRFISKNSTEIICSSKLFQIITKCISTTFPKYLYESALRKELLIATRSYTLCLTFYQEKLGKNAVFKHFVGIIDKSCH